MKRTEATRPDVAALAREFAIMGAAALLLAVVGPFGSFADPFGARLGQWLVFGFGGYLFFRPVIAAGYALAGTTGLPRLPAIACACAFAAVPTTILVALALAGWRVGAVRLDALALVYPYVLLTGALVTAAQVLLAERRAQTLDAVRAEPVEPEVTGAQPLPFPLPDESKAGPRQAQPEREAEVVPAPPPGAAFLDRLPPALGRELLCVGNEDHYVRAYTAQGSGLLLMRLRDAAAELEGVEGARVHRGWWVARRAVAEVVRRDRAVALRLVNGLEVPVARSEAAALRAAGWW